MTFDDPTLTIGRICFDDIGSVYDLWNKLAVINDAPFDHMQTMSYLYHGLNDRDGRYVIVAKTDVLVGAVMLSQIDEKHAWVSHLIVDEGAPEKTCYRLFQAVTDRAEEVGIEELFLTCTTGNPAHKAYKSLGFKPLTQTYRANMKDVVSEMKRRRKWVI